MFDFIEMYQCDWWRLYRTDNIVKQALRESRPNKMPLREELLLENIKTGSLFAYVKRDFEVPENLRKAFANVPPVLKNNNVSRDNIGQFMEKMPGKKEFGLNQGEC